MNVENATVLRMEERGERSVYMAVLCPRNGVVDISKRISSTGKTRLPDLFDDISANLDSAKMGSLKFMGDFETTSKRTGIGNSYEALRHASSIALCSMKNGRNLDSPEFLSRTLKMALDSIENFHAPACAHLKFLYLLSKNEGYAIREDFYRNLSPNEQKIFSFLIKTPVAKLEAFESSAKVFLDSIESWISANTDLILE